MAPALELKQPRAALSMCLSSAFGLHYLPWKRLLLRAALKC